MRERLDRDLTPYGLAERSRTRARDGLTTKLLLQAADGHLVEAVSIREPVPPDPRRMRRARHTVCVSSQVGCAMGCIFCASGIGGVARNLTAGEMLDQAAIVQREFGPLTNLVFMGMGEPLANYPALRRALAELCAADGFGFSARRITVSTVGLVSGIERLARDGLPVGLAVSLHAADDRLRHRLVPTSGRWPVADIVAAAAAYARATGAHRDLRVRAAGRDQRRHSRRRATGRTPETGRRRARQGERDSLQPGARVRRSAPPVSRARGTPSCRRCDAAPSP